MSITEMKLDAIMRCLTANSNEDYERSISEVRRLMQGGDCAESMPIPKKSEEDFALDILKEMGVPAHIKGHRYLVTAITAAVDKPEINDAITKELYPLVAEKHNTTGSRAERAIRHAIECAFDRCSTGTFEKYFGNTVSPDKGKPTNGEFVAQMAIVVNRRMKGVA